MEPTESVISEEGENVKANCIFCKMASNQVQSKKVYEDEKVLAILDIYPANPGHVLIMPKEHYSIMPLVPDNELGHLFVVAKAISTALLKALNVKGTNIFVANGAVAGQKSPHFLFHLIPRHESDGLNLKIPRRQISDEDLMASRELLMKKINQFLPGNMVNNSNAMEAEGQDNLITAKAAAAGKTAKGNVYSGSTNNPHNPFTNNDNIPVPDTESTAQIADKSKADLDKVASLFINGIRPEDNALQKSGNAGSGRPSSTDTTDTNKKKLSLDDISDFFKSLSKKDD